MLDEYLQQSQRFIRDAQERLVNIEDLVHYTNRARKRVAMASQSIRIKPPVSGQITGFQIINPGNGYVQPKVIISPPDAPSGMAPNPGGLQATATATVSGGTITGLTLVNGGDGYFQPFVEIVDTAGNGYGAQVVSLISPLTVTRGQQEVYPFSTVPLGSFPGVSEIYAVKSISFIYMNYRYSIPVFDFSTYQAYVRIYPQQYLYVPTCAAQYGQGVNGSIYMYPIPSYVYQMEWDTFCLPLDLESDTDFEAIPLPWTECVPYFTAHLAFLEMQNLNAGNFYLQLFEKMMHDFSAYARPGRAINPYGRWGAFT
jgi:hypothetical protein